MLVDSSCRSTYYGRLFLPPASSLSFAMVFCRQLKVPDAQGTRSSRSQIFKVPDAQGPRCSRFQMLKVPDPQCPRCSRSQSFPDPWAVLEYDRGAKDAPQDREHVCCHVDVRLQKKGVTYVCTTHMLINFVHF